MKRARPVMAGLSTLYQEERTVSPQVASAIRVKKDQRPPQLAVSSLPASLPAAASSSRTGLGGPLGHRRVQRGHSHPILWVPTVGAALLSRHHWLHVYCGGCQTVKAIDLIFVRRPLNMPVTAILRSLKCRFCEGLNPPPTVIWRWKHHELPV